MMFKILAVLLVSTLAVGNIMKEVNHLDYPRYQLYKSVVDSNHPLNQGTE